jgi:hypothetical protein
MGWGSGVAQRSHPSHCGVVRSAGMLLALAAFACTAPVAREHALSGSTTIVNEGLCVTEGEVQNRGQGTFEVASPAMRAVVAGSEPETAELRFLYKGPTPEIARLADGELHRQVGLKLRAEDSCNVVYAMWRFEPKPGVFVSVKHHRDRHHHAECTDSGYENIAPLRSTPVPAPKVGEEHVMQALLDGRTLRVVIDGQAVWEGDVGDVSSIVGPAGIRTDNTRLVFQLAAARLGGDDACPTRPAPMT